MAFTAYPADPVWFTNERKTQETDLTNQRNNIQPNGRRGKQARQALQKQIDELPAKAYENMLCPAIAEYLSLHAGELTWTHSKTQQTLHGYWWAGFTTTIYATHEIPTTIQSHAAGLPPGSTAFEVEAHFHHTDGLQHDKVCFFVLRFSTKHVFQQLHAHLLVI